jgi:pyrophosphate--fructose-6-phosphate 1-phosphotransferase
MPSLLQQVRLRYQPKLPDSLKEIIHLIPMPAQELAEYVDPSLKDLFPLTCRQPLLTFEKGEGGALRPLKVGVVLSGGQAPGGHNVIAGLFDALKRFHPDSRLIGFLDGPQGMIKNKTKEITEDLLSYYRNQGGFDIIGSGRTKIESIEQFSAVKTTAQSLDLDGIVIIGGDDSNTNAAFLAEYFESNHLKTKVIGVPKTIDGDLKNQFVEVSFGFDTACKIYSELIGNILKDTLSAKKSYYFIKLMGRSASHIALECAFQTHPNLTLISEEVAEKKQTLKELAQEIADVICLRARSGKYYGAILIPEGIIEFIPEFKYMIQEFNQLLSSHQFHSKEIESLSKKEDKIHYIAKQLSSRGKDCFLELPIEIQEQLMLERDPHGNVQVSKIETERLLINLVEKELKKRTQVGEYEGKFSAQPLFFGYEGRSGLPSNFDSQYCYALGCLAAVLIQAGVTGYLCCLKNLTKPVEEWTILGVPIFNLLHLEEREGKKKAVIKKALVELEGKPFSHFKKEREKWMIEDAYICPGPIQFEGDKNITEAIPISLRDEQLSKD